MRILILGGTAFIGAKTARQLSEAGHDVTVLHRGKTEGNLPPEVRHLHIPEPWPRIGDRVHFAGLAGEFSRLAPEVVIDMMAFTEADARHLMDSFRGLARRVVLISSQDVYRAYGRLTGKEPGPPDPVPLTEEAPLRERRYPYRGDTLRAADDPQRWVDEYDKIPIEELSLSVDDLPGTVLRLPAVYGPNDKQHRLHPYLKPMDDGRPAVLLEERYARWRWSRGYVEDIAQAIVLAATDDRAAGQTYNVADNAALPEAEWVRRIGQAAGWQGEIIPVPVERLDLPREQLPASLTAERNLEQELIASSDRIRAELGYGETVSPEDALRRTVDWERANPPAEVDPKEFDYAAEDRVLARLRGAT